MSDLFDMIDGAMAFTGVIGKIICFIGLIINAVGCFFGFKLTKFYIAVCGFGVGALLGLLLSIIMDSGFMLLVGFVLAIVCAVVAFKLYKAGVFLMSFFNSTVFAFILFFIITKSETASVIIGIIAGIAVGIVSVKFVKPTLIISTAVSYGSLAGIFLALMISSSALAFIFCIAFIAGGIFVQMKMNNGLVDNQYGYPNNYNYK